MTDLNLPPTIEGLRQANARLLKALQKERQRAGDYKRQRDEAWARVDILVAENMKLQTTK